MRRLRTPLVTAGGLVAAGAIDRALTPALHKPVSTAATAASIGSVQLYQYQVGACVAARPCMQHVRPPMRCRTARCARSRRYPECKAATPRLHRRFAHSATS